MLNYETHLILKISSLAILRNLTVIRFIECDMGKYGFNCKEQCGKCKLNTTCDFESGKCHDGCIDESYATPICQGKIIVNKSLSAQCMARSFLDKKDDGPPNGVRTWIGAGVGTLVLLAALAAGIFFIVWKRQRTKPENQMSLKPRKIEFLILKIVIWHVNYLGEQDASPQFNAMTQSSSKKQFTTKENFRTYCEAAFGSGQLVHEYEVKISYFYFQRASSIG
jgi:hypothetical protein